MKLDFEISKINNLINIEPNKANNLKDFRESI